MKKKKKIIKYPAQFIAHCPTGATYVCAKHLQQLKTLMAVLGTHIAVEIATDNKECKNCINENKN